MLRKTFHAREARIFFSVTPNFRLLGVALGKFRSHMYISFLIFSSDINELVIPSIIFLFMVSFGMILTKNVFQAGFDY